MNDVCDYIPKCQWYHWLPNDLHIRNVNKYPSYVWLYKEIWWGILLYTSTEMWNQIIRWYRSYVCEHINIVRIMWVHNGIPVMSMIT